MLPRLGTVWVMGRGMRMGRGRFTHSPTWGQASPWCPCLAHCKLGLGPCSGSKGTMSLGMNPERSMPLLPQVVIPVVSVQMVKKHKMARLLPNGLAITTNTSQKVSESLSHTLLSVFPSQPQEPTA